MYQSIKFPAPPSLSASIRSVSAQGIMSVRGASRGSGRRGGDGSLSRIRAQAPRFRYHNGLGKSTGPRKGFKIHRDSACVVERACVGACD